LNRNHVATDVADFEAAMDARQWEHAPVQPNRKPLPPAVIQKQMKYRRDETG
jgi:hypothetical protein